MKSSWQGTISFGLVNIPVRLYFASHSRELKFKLLHKTDLSEIKYARICKVEGKEVPWEDIVKGYEYKHGDFVVFTEEDFEKINPKKTKTLEILSFTSEAEVGSIYYEAPYYIEPEKGSAHAYHLLREALEKSKKVAIVKFVFRNHEHIGVIKSFEGLLLLMQLRYASELVKPKEMATPKEKAIPQKEIAVALQFIEQLTKRFNPKEYTDTYTEEIKKMIKAKAKGHKVKVQKGKALKPSKVHDIMPLLKKSLKTHAKKKHSA